MTLTAPDFKTDPFFNLEDKWIQTSSEELTHYFDNGDGVPILFLHGSGFGTSAASTWWLNIPHLSQSARTVAFDFIGYGETVCAPEARYGIKEWGAQTIRLMDALLINKAWIVGSSLGGWVALQLVIDFPERILGVVSIGTGGAKRETAPNNSNTIAKPVPLLSKSLIRKNLQKNIRNEAVISKKLVNLRFQAASREEENGLRPYLQAARDRDRHRLPLDLAALGQSLIPALLVHGMDDKVVPVSRSIELLNAMPTADAHFYSGCGHWPHISKANEFNTLVGGFISSRSAQVI